MQAPGEVDYPVLKHRIVCVLGNDRNNLPF